MQRHLGLAKVSERTVVPTDEDAAGDVPPAMTSGTRGVLLMREVRDDRPPRGVIGNAVAYVKLLLVTERESLGHLVNVRVPKRSLLNARWWPTLRVRNRRGNPYLSEPTERE